MYASQRNSLSPTWHMLLMGLMSVILFFGGLLTSNDRPVPIVDNLPNEGLLRPTSLLPWESVELSETRLLFRHEEMQEVKSPQRLNQPTPQQPSGAPSRFPAVRVGRAHARLCRTDSPRLRKGLPPLCGMGRPRLLRPAPSPARLTATRRLPDRPIFPPSRADGRAPLKGSFSPPAPQKRQSGSGETTTERRLHAPGLPDAAPMRPP